MRTFVNFSNHPSSKWSKEQYDAAMQYGVIVDIKFPMVNPNASEYEITVIGDEYVKKIMELSPVIVMCQGEFTLTYYVINKLHENGIECVSACSERVSEERRGKNGELTKVSVFRFAGFRKYYMEER